MINACRILWRPFVGNSGVVFTQRPINFKNLGHVLGQTWAIVHSSSQLFHLFRKSDRIRWWWWKKRKIWIPVPENANPCWRCRRRNACHPPPTIWCAKYRFRLIDWNPNCERWRPPWNLGRVYLHRAPIWKAGFERCECECHALDRLLSTGRIPAHPFRRRRRKKNKHMPPINQISWQSNSCLPSKLWHRALRLLLSKTSRMRLCQSNALPIGSGWASCRKWWAARSGWGKPVLLGYSPPEWF